MVHRSRKRQRNARREALTRLCDELIGDASYPIGGQNLRVAQQHVPLQYASPKTSRRHEREHARR